MTRPLIWTLALCVWFANTSTSRGDQFDETIKPLLRTYCFDCHAEGAEEGGFAFEKVLPGSDASAQVQHQTWLAVLKNLRAQIMPPADAEQPTPDERAAVGAWIKTVAFGVDPRNPDPGHVTPRRLNRNEYRNTMRDLMGVEFDAEFIFPPDDTGFGFDNVGDVLSLSPMLLEKYLTSAQQIVDQTVPKVCKVAASRQWTGTDFVDLSSSDTVDEEIAEEYSSGGRDDDPLDGKRMPTDVPGTVAKEFELETSGRYRVELRVEVDGSFNFDPSRFEVRFFADDTMLMEQQYQWDNKTLEYEFDLDWSAGKHQLTFEVQPIEPANVPSAEEVDDDGHIRFDVQSVRVVGPQAREHWIHPPNYQRFFPRDEPPASSAERRHYAREVISAFATKAFRRPADARTIDRLVALAEAWYQQPDTTFETGVAHAMVAMLTSPRFLFRLEAAEPGSDNQQYPLIDEYSLASRLSYFLWSSTPDEQLLELASRGELRQQLDDQVERMLADSKSEQFVTNFVGQWLRARDAEHVSIDTLSVYGVRDEYEQLREISRRRYLPPEDPNHLTDEQWDEYRPQYDQLREIRDLLPPETRIAMRRETEMVFEYIVRHDRSLLDLLDADYTFVNEGLAKLYGLDDVEGDQMRIVSLAQDSPRGGVLTQGTMLAVTSNPTRTSPVKRGLFILDNLLGTPSPPAPPDVPELDAAADRFGDREPTLRELLAAHREAALCSSCHSRMDPLGLALENFNAVGVWRDEELNEPIDASGQLITGESFRDIRELKKILTTSRRMDFYRCATEKLLTYALGRGLEYYDQYTIDEIAQQLDRQAGRFNVLLDQVIRSPAFQRQRRTAVGANDP